MAQKIQLRRDTAANWTSTDPVLALGEVGIETDTVKMKFGDGTTVWSLLPYYEADAIAHEIAGSEHTASTLAELNALISDATLIDTTDSRLSDARTPVAHNHVAADVTDFDSAADARISAQKAAANGIATLGADSKIPTSQLPALAISETAVVATEVAQLALTVQEGDVAVRTDLNKSYIALNDTNATMADWQELLTPTDSVLSVNSQTGAVTLDTDDISEGVNKYVSAAQKTKLDGIETAATADQTGAEIKAAYEAEANTNAFTDAEKTNLGNQSGTNTGDEVDATTTVKGVVELATDGENAANVVVQGNDSRLSDDRTADGIRTASNTVSVSAATAPTTGQILKATSTTTATWQDESGGGHTVQEEGSPLTQRTNLNFIGANVTATDNAGTDSTDITITGGASQTLASVQAERTTTWTIPTTPGNLVLDTTDVETDDTAIDHDDVNRERLNIHDSGHYHGVASFVVTNGDNIARTLTVELWLNDTTQLKSTTIEVSKSATSVVTRPLIIPPLTSGDFITIRLGSSSASSLTLETGARVCTFKLEGIQGATGATGIAGADGDMTWEGNWVSQQYTANQAVKYTDGNSYVCHTDTTSSQVPTDTNYWDILAEKGDAGSSGSLDTISIHPHNGSYKSEVSATYITQAHYGFRGTGVYTPTKIFANIFANAGLTTGKVRIYDATNSLVIAELTNHSNGTMAMTDLGTLSNLSSGAANWEIQISGDGANAINISSMSVEY